MAYIISKHVTRILNLTPLARISIIGTGHLQYCESTLELHGFKFSKNANAEHELQVDTNIKKEKGGLWGGGDKLREIEKFFKFSSKHGHSSSKIQGVGGTKKKDLGSKFWVSQL